MSDKIYHGVRVSVGEVNISVRTLAQDQSVLNEKSLHHVVYHSPTGMEWGYGGSGPHDLALSILADHFKDEHGAVTEQHIQRGGHPAVDLHNQFTFAFVSRFSEGEWVLSSEQIDIWVKGMRAAQTDQ
jgi:hypothetical protein